MHVDHVLRLQTRLEKVHREQSETSFAAKYHEQQHKNMMDYNNHAEKASECSSASMLSVK